MVWVEGRAVASVRAVVVRRKALETCIVGFGGGFGGRWVL